LARDNFTQKVINDLRNRVGLRCSKPDCRVPTIAPSNNIGQAAHICAASSGGPRYDKSMTTEERKSINNAIWLCANHATEIDRNPDAFPVELLYRWKQEAEELATNELGKKLPSDSDARDILFSTLTGRSTTFLPTAISNIHLATKESLEELDSRFSIDTQYLNNSVLFKISAKEKVVLPITIDKKYSIEFSKKYKDLLEHGKDVIIDSMAINIEGSKLFEEIFSQRGGFIQLSKPRKKAIQKLWLRDSKTNMIEAFDDIMGKIIFAEKSLRFEGSTFNGLIYFNYQYFLEYTSTTGTISIGILFDKWNNQDINKLPYFKKIFLLYSKMCEGWNMNTTLEINGEHMFTSSLMQVKQNEIYSFLDYIDKCRIIANYLNIEVPFSSEITYTEEEYHQILEVVDTIEKKNIYYKKDISSNPFFVLTANEKLGEIIPELREKSQYVTLHECKKSTIKIFNKKYTLPTKLIFLESVFMSFEDDMINVKDGESINVELIPQDDFEYRIEFEEI